MDNNPKDSSRKSPNRDRRGRSPYNADSGEQEVGDPPPTERAEQHETAAAAAAPESSTALSRTPSETPAARERQGSTTTRVQLEIGGGDGSGQRRKRFRGGDEGAGSSGGRPRKKPQEFDAPPNASPCSVCGREFGSWKALFGHMRSHPEREWRGIHPPPRFNREGTPEKESAAAEEEGGNLLLGVAQEVATRLGVATAVPVPEGQKSKIESVIEHKCNICSQVFPTGPALGGHMRSHTDKQHQAAEEASSSSLTPVQRRGLSFDLNLPIEPEAEPPVRHSSPPTPPTPSPPPPPPPPPAEGKEGGFDLNRQPSLSDDEE